MLLSNSSQIKYTSCIKISGIPILPPLITEERRKELKNDKEKAIEIEKRLKGKRSSIDSGVMTGSYIEHFKNIELQHNDESCLNPPSIHDLTVNGYIENGKALVTGEAGSYLGSDSFLKSALEDPEFREFFSATAEKMFKDNKIKNVVNSTGGNEPRSYEVQHESNKENEILYSDVLSESSSFVKPSESSDLSFSNSISRGPSVVAVDITVECLESVGINGSESGAKEIEEPSSPPQRIRRNSYTLESPSSVLLEHMAKEIASGKNEADTWQSLSDKRDEVEGPGFKTFSGQSQRKQWNKNCNLSSNIRVESQRTRHTLVRSNTFVKPKTKVGESNYSLPCSSRTSPLQFCSFTRSVDCIKSMVANPQYQLNQGQKNDSLSPESVDNDCVSQIPSKDTLSCVASDSETFIVKKSSDIQSASTETSPKSLKNNPSCSAQSSCSTDNCSPPQVEFSDSASQISVATHSTYLQQNSICSRNTNNDNTPNNINRLEDFDDIASLCSSLSISRFLQSNDVSRPSTAENVSEANICLLKMKHDNELRELLEKQRKEEELYSQLLSTSGSLTSRTATNLSIGDPLDSSSDIVIMDKRESCSRELFPLQQNFMAVVHTKPHPNYSEREKAAATKLVAYAKGYLTRRLLKTEKVQKLIDMIKESLTCAFSLQLEPYLKPTDLDLHARLAHQLTATLSELQSIVSAPAAVRMAIIAADRERLRKPASRPSSTISLATLKSISRRQQSSNSLEKKPHQSRARTKSFSVNGSTTGSVCSGSRLRSDSTSTVSSSSNRPWR